MGSLSSGEWLEKALFDICSRLDNVSLDSDLISGLVSFCELAPPPDAADYIKNIIGADAGRDIIREYLWRRGYDDPSYSSLEPSASNVPSNKKTPLKENTDPAATKPVKSSKEASVSAGESSKKQVEVAGSTAASKGNTGTSRKKKTGKAISLAEAVKGSVVFQQGKPCSCQARRHKLVSNCLSCGKIVCEQEGEGPCSFCGALVLKEGSTYAGLEDQIVPLSDTEAAAEAYAKRLVDYDRNAAARTKVIDDQSDYYEIEGNSWLSPEEKDLLRKKQKEIEEAEEARKKKLIVTFDLLGRKVVMSKDEASELESDLSILRPSEEREGNRIKPNPAVKVHPVFITQPSQRPAKRQQNNKLAGGLCLEISGRVQHDGGDLRRFMIDGSGEGSSLKGAMSVHDGDAPECSVDYD